MLRTDCAAISVVLRRVCLMAGDLPVGPADAADAEPPGRRRRRPVRSPGDPRRHRDRRHRRAAARPDGHRGAEQSHHRRLERRLPRRADQRARPAAKGTKEIDGTGMYLMPGFVDAHVHCGGGQARDPEYVYKLWLAHGVTTVRGVPCGSMDWDLNQRELSAKNQIVAPRIFSYHRPFSGEGWDRTAAADAGDGARVGALCRQEGRRRPEARRARSRDHGGAARRGEEAQPRLDRAPRSDGRGAHERARRVAARPRHADALLRPVRVAAQGLHASSRSR